MGSLELQRLLQVLDEHHISDVDPDRIVDAFQDADLKPKMSAWVKEYLQPANVLTREEVELCVDFWHPCWDGFG
jgi:hypothetical protein